nr:hypothetical protein [Tanacetum cinerariifolium]
MLTISKAVIILLSVSQNLVSIVSTKLRLTLRAIVGRVYLAAAAELSSTLHPGLGAVSSSLFGGGVSALGISALRLVDGTGRVCGGQIRGGKKDGGSGGVAQWDQVHTLENVVPAPVTIEQPPRKEPHMEYSKIVP